MKILLMMLLAGAAWAQRGEAVFKQSCASGYCHGDRGAGAGAPRLAARGFTPEFITSTVSGGVKGTSMPSFTATLSPADLRAVVGYVAGLNGVTATGAPVALEARGSSPLFRDAVRGFGRCSTCHEVARIGIPVASPIVKVPASAATLKALATPRVVTVQVGNETMPGLVVAKKATEVTFYDLTSAPPVLRTVAPNEFVSREGSTWKHADFIKSYSDTELTAILAYLRLAVR